MPASTYFLFCADSMSSSTCLMELFARLNRMIIMDDFRVKARLKLRAKYGPDLIEQLLETVPSLPAEWLELAPDHGFERLRCMLRFSQDELGRKTGMTQARISRIEGGADIRFSVWKKIYAAMGFDLILMPVSRSTVE